MVLSCFQMNEAGRLSGLFRTGIEPVSAFNIRSVLVGRFQTKEIWVTLVTSRGGKSF